LFGAGSNLLSVQSAACNAVTSGESDAQTYLVSTYGNASHAKPKLIRAYSESAERQSSDMSVKKQKLSEVDELIARPYVAYLKGQSELSATPCSALSEEFESWWAVNHPLDWWTKKRGDSLPHGDRLLVWEIARQAYIAGRQAPNARADLPPR